ncbi:hypothetical protein IEO21_03841 [Rhodonia placenta]|uniref:CBF1-interacting co-repressor CIR N-terminal domain-containing protein n=1 Tax=Rhodonia placenta TaxID=104341 RepID=A0A8H7P541_9APHY|nr:hypothetical protein IEO21_03841 [Postia placenta]
MGKLNIAHHKSYHPYRRDNIERVRRDEQEAREKDAIQEGRMMLADSEARIDLLRQRAGGARTKDRHEDDSDETALQPGPSSIASGGHINLFEDLERSMFSDPRSTKKAPPETEKGIPLAPAAKDLNPWYSDGASGKERETNEDRKIRDLARKSVNDPLTSINHQLAARPSSSTSTSRRPRPAAPAASSGGQQHAADVRLVRESSERQRALELIRRKKREAAGSETPSTVHGGMSERVGYGDVFNRREVDEARRHRDRRWGGDSRPDDGRSRARCCAIYSSDEID